GIIQFAKGRGVMLLVSYFFTTVVLNAVAPVLLTTFGIVVLPEFVIKALSTTFTVVGLQLLSTGIIKAKIQENFVNREFGLKSADVRVTLKSLGQGGFEVEKVKKALALGILN
ncbi:MAG: hypothetical protein KAR32_13185, partial [Candidatus Omnitrophica bacterium]|nr:hypothetical protein [Candidatus Omnitrophota bacterium]